MKTFFFFIDDNIWFFRDLAEKRPASLFDNAYLGFLKRMHDEYGAKTQLNIFYATSPEHDPVEFNLSMVPDIWKDEWKANADWLKLSFHATREFPDWPYVNAKYDDFKFEFDRIINEIKRFAGEEVISTELVTHWLPLSKESYKVLTERDVKAVCATYGLDAPESAEADLSASDLQRLNEGRTEETSKVYYNCLSSMDNYYTAIRAYNHIPHEVDDLYRDTCKFYTNEDYPIPIKQVAHITLNMRKLDEIVPFITTKLDNEYFGICMHEQYYYPFYKNYQPDWCNKIETTVKFLTENGFKSIFLKEIL